MLRLTLAFIIGAIVAGAIVHLTVPQINLEKYAGGRHKSNSRSVALTFRLTLTPTAN